MRSLLVGTAVLALSMVGIPAVAQNAELTVLSFNVHGGGANQQKPIDDTLAVFRAANADIIGLQETRIESAPCTAEFCPPAGDSVAPKLAEALGYHVYEQTAINDALWANAILSRYPIGKATPNDLGVEIDVGGRRVQVFNIHLRRAPYQPYQLFSIEYGPFPHLKTADEAIEAAKAARGPALKLLFDDMAAAGDGEITFVLGDFNEPSHRDWTEAAVEAGLQPMVVAYPTVKAIEAKGFVDTFRAVFPDAATKPGFTWTPDTEPIDPRDHHDRIDFVLARAKSLQVVAAGIVGEKAPEADIVMLNWPSDHRAVMAKVKF